MQIKDKQDHNKGTRFFFMTYKLFSKLLIAMPMKPKTCQNCGQNIHGRSDKKFCDDQCRTEFNNRLKSEPPYVRSVNSILKRNRSIIQKLMPTDASRVKINRYRLNEFGFNFMFYTHSYTTKSGTRFMFCYEYGYLQLDQNRMMLLKRNGS